MKKCKIILLMLMFMTGMFILSACSGGASETDTPEKEQKKESSAGLSQFASENGEMWSDSWSTDTASGASMDIKVNALIEVPKLNQMSIVEVQMYEFNEENKKKVAEAIFGGEVYYNDEEHLPGPEIQKLLDDWQESERAQEAALRDLKADDKTDEKEIREMEKEVEEDREKVKKYEKLLKKAPDDFMKVEGDYKGDDYMGERDGIRYRLYFDADEAASVHGIEMVPYNQEDVSPDELKGQERVLSHPVDIELESENKCKVTKAEAEKTAREFLQKAGFTDLILAEEQTLRWIWGETETELNTNYLIDGWHFTFSLGAEDAPFSDYVEFYDYAGGTMETGTEIISDERFSLDCSITVSITDKGVIEVQVNNPITILSSVSGVKLLPLEEIKKIIRNEAGEFAGFLQETNKASHLIFTRLSLGYYRTSDPANKDLYTYVPAWRLWSNSGNSLSYVVNAVDGSVMKDCTEKQKVVSKTE